jgi:hypothetical protein
MYADQAGLPVADFKIAIPCEFRVAPYAAAPDKLTTTLAPIVTGKTLAEMQKTLAEAPFSGKPGCPTPAQELIGKADNAIAADPRAFCSDFTKVGLIDLTAPACAPDTGSRAAYADKADDAKTLAIRGGPCPLFLTAAGVPFEMLL